MDCLLSQVKVMKPIALSPLVTFAKRKWISLTVRRRNNPERAIRRCSRHGFGGSERPHVFKIGGLGTDQPDYHEAG